MPRPLLRHTLFPLFLLLMQVQGNVCFGQATRPSVTVPSDSAVRLLGKMEAGSIIPESAIRHVDIRSCFVSLPISGAVFARMRGKSYPDACTVPLNDLRYLRVLHRTADSSIRIGELVCHKDLSADLLDIFRQLFMANYPIERMVIIDSYDANDEQSMEDNNTSCFCFRPVSGSRRLSLHSYGRAVDINPLYNPCVSIRRNGQRRVQPAAAAPYADRSRQSPYKIERCDLCYRLFIQHGFRWGGDWRTTKDYQHFEKPAQRRK